MKDLTDTSLASRVCDEDGSLIFSNLQATLVEDINHFLGLKVGLRVTGRVEQPKKKLQCTP